MMKKFGIYFLMIVFGLLISLASLEILLRTYYHLTNSKTEIQWQYDSLLGKRLKPNQSGLFVSHTNEYKTNLEINSEGWRDSEHQTEKPDDIYRILIIGDSFVENFQVTLDKTFFKQLENKLEIKDKKVEVIAMGLGDTGTTEQYLILKEYGLKYKPDLVVHMFFSGNDVKNNSRELMNDPYRPYFELQDNNLVYIPPESKPNSLTYKIKEILKKNFRIVELILDFKGNIKKRQSLSQVSDYPTDYHVYDGNYSEEYTKAWEVTKKLILETKKVAEENGAAYLLVSSSNNEQVNSDVWEALKAKYPKISDVNLEKPDQELGNFCEEHSIDCEFMLNYFKSNATEKTHYTYDGHWNEFGTNLTANFLVEKINNLLEDQEITQN